MNSGADTGRVQYMRLLSEECEPLSAAVDCLAPVEENKHAPQPLITWQMGSQDAFLWLEFGHRNAGNVLVPDQLVPIEIQHTTAACPP